MTTPRARRGHPTPPSSMHPRNGRVPLPGHRRPRPLTGCKSRLGGSPVHRTDRHDPRGRRHLHSGFLRPRPRPTERRRSVAVPVASADQRGPSPTCQECGRPSPTSYPGRPDTGRPAPATDSSAPGTRTVAARARGRRPSCPRSGTLDFSVDSLTTPCRFYDARGQHPHDCSSSSALIRSQVGGGSSTGRTTVSSRPSRNVSSRSVAVASRSR